MRLRRLISLLAVASLAGCPTPDESTGIATTMPPEALLDYNEFVCAAQPVLIKRCSFIACHGQEEHALRIYSVGKLRISTDLSRQAQALDPLTAEEVLRNFRSAAAFVYPVAPADRQGVNTDVSKVLLLEKPLAARLGGGQHHGVEVFPAWPATALDKDPEWLALLNWIGSKKQPKPVSTTCQALFDAMGLAPK